MTEPPKPNIETKLTLIPKKESIRDQNILKTFCKDISKINDLDECGWTPLYRTVVAGDIYASTLLLNNGANPNIKCNMGETALYQAVDMEKFDQVKLLLQNGADPNISQDDGLTPLHLAVNKQNLLIVKILLKNNANPNLKSKIYEQTPLHLAIKNNIDPMILLLLVQFNGSLTFQDKFSKKPVDYIHSEEMKNTIEKLKLEKEKKNKIVDSIPVYITPKKYLKLAATPVYSNTIHSKSLSKDLIMGCNTVLRDPGLLNNNIIEIKTDIKNNNNIVEDVRKDLFNSNESHKKNKTDDFIQKNLYEKIIEKEENFESYEKIEEKIEEENNKNEKIIKKIEIYERKENNSSNKEKINNDNKENQNPNDEEVIIKTIKKVVKYSKIEKSVVEEESFSESNKNPSEKNIYKYSKIQKENNTLKFNNNTNNNFNENRKEEVFTFRPNKTNIINSNNTNNTANQYNIKKINNISCYTKKIKKTFIEPNEENINEISSHKPAELNTTKNINNINLLKKNNTLYTKPLLTINNSSSNKRKYSKDSIPSIERIHKKKISKFIINSCLSGRKTFTEKLDNSSNKNNDNNPFYYKRKSASISKTFNIEEKDNTSRTIIHMKNNNCSSNTINDYSENNSNTQNYLWKFVNDSLFNDKNSTSSFNGFIDIDNFSNNNIYPIYDWLKEINLHCYYNLFIEKKIYCFDKMIQNLRTGEYTITKNDISKIGITIPGHIYRIITKIEIDSEKINNNISNYLIKKNFITQNNNINILTNSTYYCYGCCTMNEKSNNQRKSNGKIFNLEQWLSKINMSKYKQNFIENGFEMFEYFILQMFSTVPIDENIIKEDLKITNDNDRDIILLRLIKDTKYIMKKVKKFAELSLKSSEEKTLKIINTINNKDTDDEKKENDCNIF